MTVGFTYIALRTESSVRNGILKWVTRENVHVDRTACPWLIKRFIDRRAEFVFVPADKIGDVVRRDAAIPFDAPDVELGHHGNKCSFDAIVEKYHIEDPAILKMAEIVRAADTDPSLASEGSGVEALMAGVSMIAKNDHDSLRLAGPIYDALFGYCKMQVIKEKHASELEKMNKKERRVFLRGKINEWGDQ